MATAGKGFHHSSVFNYELFKINQSPLEFSLDGFNETESAEIAKIVEVFGGKFLETSRLDTIIFVDPNNMPGLYNYYDIKFLQDSVAAQKLQKLEDYCISSSRNRKIRNTTTNSKSLSSDGECQLKDIDNDTQEEHHGTKTNYRNREICSKCQTTQKTIERCPFCSHLNIETSKNMESTVENATSRFNDSNMLSGSIDELDRSENVCSSIENFILKSEMAATNNTKNIQRKDDELVRDRSPELDDTTSFHSDSEDYLKNELSEDEALKIKVACSAARVRVYKRRPTELTSELQGSESDDEDSAMNPKKSKFSRSARSQSRSSEKVLLPLSSNSHIYASSTSSASPSPPSYTISSDTESSEDYTPKKAKPRRVTKPRKSYPMLHRYTEEENDRMMQFVINKKAIDRAHTIGLWTEFLANEPIDEPIPSVTAVRRHFQEILQRKDIRQYTNDPLAIKQLELFQSRKTNNNRWTSGERQIMIDYLIQNDEIDLLPSRDIWAQCLRVNSLLREKGRTVRAMWSQFRTYLLHNYAKYTKDRKALKQFKKLQDDYPDGYYQNKNRAQS